MTEQPADRVRERVKQLVELADRLGIDPDLLSQYAELHAMAELQTERDDETEAIRKEAQVGFTRAVFGLPMISTRTQSKAPTARFAPPTNEFRPPRARQFVLLKDLRR